jgi:hypothetical protein
MCECTYVCAERVQGRLYERGDRASTHMFGAQAICVLMGATRLCGGAEMRRVGMFVPSVVCYVHVCYFSGVLCGCRGVIQGRWEQWAIPAHKQAFLLCCTAGACHTFGKPRGTCFKAAAAS